MGLLDKIFGTRSQREVKRLQPILDKILNLEEEYKALSDEELQGKTEIFKARLAQGARIVEVLKQKNGAPLDVAYQVCILFAVTRGYLKDVPVDQIAEFQSFYFDALDGRYAGILQAIRESGKLDSETEAALCASLEETVSVFLAR